jgi:serine/threonine-protein kinase RsbW
VPDATRTLTLAADAAALHAAMEFARAGARDANLPENRIDELDLLIEEIFMNVCRHAYPDGRPGVVQITCAVPARGELRVEVADQGAEFNPLAAPAPDITLSLEDRPIGGLGVLLMKTLAPSIAYRRDRDWNRLTFGISADS